MLNFKSPKDINAFFAGWHLLSEAERLQTIRDLRTEGNLTIVPNGTPTDSGFACPINGFSLARPCNIDTCQYYIGPKIVENKKRTPKVELLEAQAISSAESKNCLIMCLDRSKNSRLSAQEVATVMGISVSEVNTINNNAIAKIRRAKIKERIERLQLPRFKYLGGFCVACEMNIEDELDLNTRPELNVVVHEFGWCSEGCKQDKPKWQFQIERQFHCDFIDALAVGASIHTTYETLGNVFGVNNDYLKEYKGIVQKRKNEHYQHQY